MDLCTLVLDLGVFHALFSYAHVSFLQRDMLALR